MKATVVLGALMIVGFVGTAFCQTPDDQSKGSSLYKACKANIRANESDDASVSDVEYAFRCTGYLQGVMDTLPFIVRPPFCLTDGSTVGTVSHVYVKFMDDNPKYLDMHRTIGFVEAMKATYPCSN